MRREFATAFHFATAEAPPLRNQSQPTLMWSFSALVTQGWRDSRYRSPFPDCYQGRDLGILPLMSSLKVILDALNQEPIVDVHEHHIPEILNTRSLGLLQLLRQSYAGWSVARPYALPSERRDHDPMLENSDNARWEDIRQFVEERGSNHFVRHMIQAILDLHAPGETAIGAQNWVQIDQAIRQAHRQAGWVAELQRRAGIETIITDPYTDPLLDTSASLGQSYRSVMRINSLAVGWHPTSTDHNGNSAHRLLERVGCRAVSFADFATGIEHLVATMGSRHQVALKNALAYDRDLHFAPGSPEQAQAAWGTASPGEAARQDFGNWVVDHLCRLAGQRDIPMQMHLGTAILRGSHPLNVAPLIERHPGTRFLLMHLAYPWSRDLLAMAFVYRNIWIDLTWSLLLSPSHFKLALHEAIELLPDESRLVIGGDNWHAEETWATMRLARRLIAEVLAEKVDQGYFRVEDALRLGAKILHRNARRFFGV